MAGAASPGEPGASAPGGAGVPASAGGVPVHGAGVPADGVLEELDGRPIGPPSALAPGAVSGSPAVPDVPWRRGVAAATAMTVRRPSLWALALVAFLARGGLVILVLPIVVVPTFIGLANFVGPASVSAGGPGPRLIALIVAGLAAAVALVVVGACVAAAAEVALHRATVATPEAGSVVPIAPRADTQAPAGSLRAVARVAGVRLVLLVPVAVATAVAIPAWVAVAYHELTVPSDVAAPLAARVVAGAPAASIAVVVTWLAAEIVGGFAARRSALLGTSIPRALARGMADPFRAPLATALTVVAALGATVVVLVPTWWATGAAWDAARQALAGETGVVAAFGTALLLAAAWLAGLALAGIAAAWRATLVTMELLRRRR
jgi:hypothetical protein